MAASGLLQSDKVVFYHPLNSGAVEFCQNQPWSGGDIAYVVGAKIDQGLVGEPTGDPVFSAQFTANSGTHTGGISDRDIRPIWLTETMGVAIDRTTQPVSGQIFRYDQNGFVPGDHFEIDTMTFETSLDRQKYSVDRLSSSGFVVVYESGSNVSGVVRYYSVDGFSATLENSIGFTSVDTDNMDVTHITPSSFVVGYSDATNSRGKSVVGKIDLDTGSITLGSETEFESVSNTNYISIDRLADDRVVLVHSLLAGVDRAYAQIGEINDTSITWGAQAQYSSGSLDSQRSYVSPMYYDRSIESGWFGAIYAQQNAGFRVGVCSIGVISGSTINFVASEEFTADRFDDGFISAESSGTLGILYLDNTSSDNATYRKATWDGDTGLSFGSETEFATGGVGGLDGHKLRSGPYVVGYVINAAPGHRFLKFGQQYVGGTLSTSGDNYASASGQTKIAMCGWFRRPTVSGNIEIERDYKITIGSGHISLGSGTSTWNDAGTQSVLDILNNGDEHFLVLDFENTGGSSWDLKTSLDGSGFVNQGAENTGSQAVVGTNSDPAIRMFSGTYPTWLDEIALWANHTEFTSTELSQLYQLGNDLALSLDNYDTAFPPPTASMSLFIESASGVSGDMDLFIGGTDNSSGSMSLSIPNVVDVTSGSMSLFTLAGANVEQMDLFIEGAPTNDIPLYIAGSPSGGMDLFVDGIGGSSGDLNISITGHIPISGDIPLFLKGFPGEFNVFVQVVDNAVTGDMQLFINGVESGTVPPDLPPGTPIFYNANDMSLFVSADGVDNTVTTDFDAFVGVTSGLQPFDDAFNAFVRVGGTSENSVSLFMFAHASGEQPAGLPSEQELTLFVEGLGLVTTDGFTPVADTFDSFVRVYSGSNQDLGLYMSGAIDPTGSLGLYTFGVSGIPASSIALSMFGHEGPTQQMNLSMFGVSGILESGMNLFISADLGATTKPADLYIHGF